MKKALIVVDIQNDFCHNGSLEVADAEQIIPYVNHLMKTGNYDEIILTQDFHPKGHFSFASTHRKNIGDSIILDGVEQILWADHCMQGTFGAEFHQDLEVDLATKIIQKGTILEIDSYSAFFDNYRKNDTGLSQYLKSKNIGNVEVVGLALDYCVKYTCLDAVSEGFATTLHFRGTKAVNINPDDAQQTIYELLEKGICIKA